MCWRKNATILAMSFWIADRPDRLGFPLACGENRQDAAGKGEYDALKAFGLCPSRVGVRTARTN